MSVRGIAVAVPVAAAIGDSDAARSADQTQGEGDRKRPVGKVFHPFCLLAVDRDVSGVTFPDRDTVHEGALARFMRD